MMYGVGGLIILALVVYFVARPESEELNLTEVQITNPATLRDDLVPVNVIKEGEYTADPESSQIMWTGSLSVTGASNKGIVRIQEGFLSASDGNISAGEIVVNMNSVISTETILSGTNDATLDEHLKGADFFDVATYPTSKIVLRSVILRNDLGEGKYDVVADLTLKDQTHEVLFPVEILEVDDIIVMRGDLEIDRTKWGVTFRSGRFFDSLGDTALSDTITLRIELVATAGRG